MCGIAASYNCRKAAEVTYAGLHAIQHRAQDFAGMATSDGTNLFYHAGPGIVQEVFDNQKLSELHGLHAVGHIRYPTVDDDKEKMSQGGKTQPLISCFGNREIALAHNGNLLNYDELAGKLQHRRLKTEIDTELILRLFCESKADNDFNRVFDAVRYAKGSYSLVFLYDNEMIAVRDPFGNRPLALGRKDDSWFLSSETVAFDNLGIKLVRELAPGEILIINQQGLQSSFFDENGLQTEPLISHVLAKCVFELIYYSHPASIIDGVSVANFQMALGRQLAKECPVEADIVVGVPDSAIFHANGYSQESGLPLIPGITRSHYIGRTFIEPFQWLRDLRVRRKFTVIRELVEGKRIVLIDDSIFRLTTMRGLVGLIWAAEAKEIHARIASPPVISPCYNGIDVPSEEELVAARQTIEKTRKQAGLTSLEHLSFEGLVGTCSDPSSYCFACMNREYKIAPELCRACRAG